MSFQLKVLAVVLRGILTRAFGSNPRRIKCIIRVEYIIVYVNKA